jgi:hypothetical protein
MNMLEVVPGGRTAQVGESTPGARHFASAANGAGTDQCRANAVHTQSHTFAA